MKRSRLLVLGLAFLFVLMGLTPGAEAASGPPRLQRLATAQTQLLFRFFHGGSQSISPQHCNQGQDPHGRDGVFLLPTNSFGVGNQTVFCKIDTRRVLVDLGGFVVSEDARGDTYTLADGTVLEFTRANLPAICDDALRLFTAVPATLDGQPVSGTPVVTGNFIVKVNPDANTANSPYYQDSVDLGHPGRLAACYTGYKALLRLAPGVHVITVDLTGFTGAPTVFTYVVKVNRHRR